jgi:hypothetical protein
LPTTNRALAVEQIGVGVQVCSAMRQQRHRWQLLCHQAAQLVRVQPQLLTVPYLNIGIEDQLIAVLVLTGDHRLLVKQNIRRMRCAVPTTQHPSQLLGIPTVGMAVRVAAIPPLPVVGASGRQRVR